MSKELREARKELTTLRHLISGFNAQVNQIQNKILELERTDIQSKLEPRLTDHALIRYLERVKNFDFTSIKNDIMTDQVKNSILAGAKTVTIDGVRFIIKDNAIVTTYED